MIQSIWCISHTLGILIQWNDWFTGNPVVPKRSHGTTHPIVHQYTVGRRSSHSMGIGKGGNQQILDVSIHSFCVTRGYMLNGYGVGGTILVLLYRDLIPQIPLSIVYQTQFLNFHSTPGIGIPRGSMWIGVAGVKVIQ